MIPYVVADTHLGHDLIRDYCGRPENHESRILSGIRRTVGANDVLVHLGDVCMYRDDFWHGQIREACAGKLWLVRGNHDRKTVKWYLERGWDFVADSIELRMFGLRILLTHEPRELSDDWDVNVHGHLHNTGHREGGRSEKHRLVFMEHHYCPVRLRKVVEG